MEGPDSEDKIFVAFMAVCVTFMGLLIGASLLLVVGAMWQAGLMNFVGWISGFAVVAFISKLVYNLMIRRGWF